MLQRALSRKRMEGTRVISTYPGQQVTLSNLVSFEVITPQVDFPQVLGENSLSSETTLSDEKLRNLNELFANNNENDLSIGVKVLIGNVSIFTSGDLEEKGEIAIIEKALLDSVDILKVGHHGSKSSSSRGFIELLQPEVSVISSGKNNQYNHPNPQVVELLQKNLSNIFQTSESGAVKFESDGTVFWQKL